MGVDIGGTFVDFALRDDHGELTKVPAEPGDLAGSMLRGITELAEQRDVDLSTFLGATTHLVHGTTVATNAVLTGTGTHTGLITTRGTRDALEMRRGVKEEPLDNKYEPPPPMVPRYLRLPVDERVYWKGNVLEELNGGSLDAAIAALKFHEVESAALCTPMPTTHTSGNLPPGCGRVWRASTLRSPRNSCPGWDTTAA